MDSPLLARSLHLESKSRDTLQNLRHARDMLRASGAASSERCGGAGRVTLLSNRYHLARCAKLADQLRAGLGIVRRRVTPAVEPQVLWRIGDRSRLTSADDIAPAGALIGSQRMLARVT